MWILPFFLFSAHSVANEYKVIFLLENVQMRYSEAIPWFYRDELLSADTFPWMKDLSPRLVLLLYI